jgi:predicted ATP-binding protein involved in virulence
MDLLYRIVQANPEHAADSKLLLSAPGVVLIDDIDSHLYPSWQQRVLPALLKTFPKIQFIVTTQSPCALTSVKPHQVLCLKDGVAEGIDSNTYGASSADVLTSVFGINLRPPNEVTGARREYFDLINDDKGETDEAMALRNFLDEWLSSDYMLDKADIMIKKKKIDKKLRLKNVQNRAST